MTDLRTAAQQALEALKTGGWNMTTRAIADLERALAQQDEPEGSVCARCGALAFDPLVKQQAEPQGCATEEDCTKQPWCRIRGECQRKQAEPVQDHVPDAGKMVQEPVQDQRCRAEPRSDGDFVCDCKIGGCPGRSAEPAQQAEPTRSQQMVAAGFKPRDRRLECDECGGKFTAQMLPIHKCAQQAEPVEPAKPVAQQAKPLTGLDMFLDPADGLKPKPYKPRAEPVLQTRKDGHYSVAYRCKCGHEQNVTEIVQGGRTYAGSGANWCDGCGDGPPVRVDAMQQQAEPVEPVAWNWMLDGQPYGQAYYGNPPDTDIAERAAIAGRTVRLLYTAPPKDEPKPMHPELRKMWEDYFDKCFRAMPVPKQAEPVQKPVNAAIKAVEEGK